MKKGELLSRGLLFIAVLMTIFIGVASAGFWDDFRATITGKATSGTTSVNITVGATPTITFVSAHPTVSVTENDVKYISFNFTAADADGASDIDTTSAKLRINITGESNRFNNTCVTQGSSFGNSQNFTCIIDLWYFDGAGLWSVNATVADNAGALATNHTQTFTVNELTAIVIHPSALTWPGVAVTDTDTLSSNDPLVTNNTGNDDIASGNVRINAINLAGEVTTTDFIFAGNFTSHTSDTCNSGTVLVNGTATGVTGSVLAAGNNSVNDGATGQEQLYFCLEALNPGIASQSYSSSAGGAWTLSVV